MPRAGQNAPHHIKNGLSGFANMNSTCTDQSHVIVSLPEIDKNLEKEGKELGQRLIPRSYVIPFTAATIAHEIGHLMNLQHMDENTTMDSRRCSCSMLSGKCLMYFSSIAPTSYKFSECSIRSLQGRILAGKGKEILIPSRVSRRVLWEIHCHGYPRCKRKRKGTVH